jgi:hypothetical protein
MAERNKRYQLGNYIQDWRKNVAMVKEIDQKGILASYYDDHISHHLEWHDFSPLEIRVDLLEEMEFVLIKRKQNMYHQDISMAINLNGKFYNARGIIYEDNNIWTFQSITVLYIHQIQNIISIIEPRAFPSIKCDLPV